MTDAIERNLGEQPLARIMANHSLKPRDLVENSTQHITYKMVSRATKGRRLTRGVQTKLLVALNQAAGKTYALEDLFTYSDGSAGVRKSSPPGLSAG
jgi:hypothetical protein